MSKAAAERQAKRERETAQRTGLTLTEVREIDKKAAKKGERPLSVVVSSLAKAEKHAIKMVEKHTGKSAKRGKR